MSCNKITNLHIANTIQQTIIELQYEIRPHAAHSTDCVYFRLSFVSFDQTFLFWSTIQQFEDIETFLKNELNQNWNHFITMEYTIYLKGYVRS